MKRGLAGLFGSKRFLRNAAIVLAIAFVAYVVMYGVKEGFQTQVKEYKFNVYTNKSSSPLKIPEEDYVGKTIKNIKIEVYAPATAGATAATAKEYIMPKFTNTTGGLNIINRLFQPSQAAIYTKPPAIPPSKSSMTYNIRGPIYARAPAANDIKIPNEGVSGSDPRLKGGIHIFVDPSYANMAGNDVSKFDEKLYNAKATLEFV